MAKTPSTFSVNDLRRLRLRVPRLQGSVSAVGEDTKIGILKTILLSVRGFLPRHAAVAAENLALRRQLAVVSQSVKRPNLRPRDRLFWSFLSHLWPHRRSALVIVKASGLRRHWFPYGARRARPVLRICPEVFREFEPQWPEIRLMCAPKHGSCVMRCVFRPFLDKE